MPVVLASYTCIRYMPMLRTPVSWSTVCTSGRVIKIEVGGGFYARNHDPTLINSILWGNQDKTGSGESAQILVVNGVGSIDYSNVQGWTGNLGGTGNRGSDPGFVDPDGIDGVPGTLDDNPPLRIAIQALTRCSISTDPCISVVVSAGNNPSSEVSQQVPATYPEVMAIASTAALPTESNKCRRSRGLIIQADTASWFTTDGDSEPGNCGAVSGLRGRATSGAGATGDPVRRLRRLAASMVEGRVSGKAAGLLEGAVGGPSGRAGAP